MDLQDLFRRSIAIWWRVRALWVVGVLAALVGYGEYGASANFQWRTSTITPLQPGGPSPLDQLRADSQIAWLLGHAAAIIIVLAIIGALWAIVGGLVGALAHGALIQIADDAGGGRPTGLGIGIRAGAGSALTIFLLNLALALPVLVIIAAALAIFGVSFWQILSRARGDPNTILPLLFGSLICALPLAFLGAFLSLALHLIGRLAARACVIEGLGPLAGIGRGWGMLRRNLGPTLLFWLLMGVLGLALGALMGLPTLALIIPIFAGVADGGLAGLPIFAVVGLLIYGLVANVGVGGVLTGLSATIWTLFYRQLLAREAPSAPPMG